MSSNGRGWLGVSHYLVVKIPVIAPVGTEEAALANAYLFISVELLVLSPKV